ncbi:hypothetical protein [Actinoplanes sp. NPDC089786]|uniref:hypothetical protein n=1 Tax=Actinoplanes sp. NPDC089786 TaxID=3155185 RepID=UPI0034309D35
MYSRDIGVTPKAAGRFQGDSGFEGLFDGECSVPVRRAGRQSLGQRIGLRRLMAAGLMPFRFALMNDDRATMSSTNSRA